VQSHPLAQGVTANTISLLLGHPDPSTLFTPEFQEAVQRVLTSPQPYQALQYGAEQGAPALIDYLVEKFNREQATSLSRDRVMAVAGSTHAVDMIARLYANAGEAVIVEAPSYVDALHVFRDHGVELYSAAIDEQGLVPEALEQILRRLHRDNRPPRFLYTIPNFHNPTGVTLSAARRVEILRLAQQYQLMVVEDDVYRDLAFDGPVPASLLALAGDVPVLHIGSFSKTLAPGLRLGWLIGSRESIQRFVQCGTTEMGGGASPFTAQIVAEYCHLGHWEAHIAHLCDLYRARRDMMLAALQQHMPDRVQWTKPAGGFFIWVTLPENVQARGVKAEALRRGVLVAAGEGYFVNPAEGEHNLRLTYSFAPPENIERGVRVLGEIIERQAKATHA
jgi:DNA-binding transcriptional MocR family regulator